MCISQLCLGKFKMRQNRSHQRGKNTSGENNPLYRWTSFVLGINPGFGRGLPVNLIFFMYGIMKLIFQNPVYRRGKFDILFMKLQSLSFNNLKENS